LLGAGIATGLSLQVSGFIAIPTALGIGLELVPNVERRFPYRPRPIRMRPHQDGSVVDQ
jgi:galactonate dehydratase